MPSSRPKSSSSSVSRKKENESATFSSSSSNAPTTDGILLTTTSTTISGTTGTKHNKRSKDANGEYNNSTRTKEEPSIAAPNGGYSNTDTTATSLLTSIAINNGPTISKKQRGTSSSLSSSVALSTSLPNGRRTGAVNGNNNNNNSKQKTQQPSSAFLYATHFLLSIPLGTGPPPSLVPQVPTYYDGTYIKDRHNTNDNSSIYRHTRNTPKSNITVAAETNSSTLSLSKDILLQTKDEKKTNTPSVQFTDTTIMNPSSNTIQAISTIPSGTGLTTATSSPGLQRTAEPSLSSSLVSLSPSGTVTVNINNNTTDTNLSGTSPLTKDTTTILTGSLSSLPASSTLPPSQNTDTSSPSKVKNSLPLDPSHQTVSSTLVPSTVKVTGSKFRYIRSFHSRSSTDFQDTLRKEKVLDGRILFSSNRNYPSAIISFLRYDAAAENAALRYRQEAATRLFTDPVYDDEMNMATSTGHSNRHHNHHHHHHHHTDGIHNSTGNLSVFMRWKERSHQQYLYPSFPLRSNDNDGGRDGIRNSTKYSTNNNHINNSTNVSIHSSDSVHMYQALSIVKYDNPVPGDLLLYNPNSIDDPLSDAHGRRIRYEKDGYLVSIIAYRTPQEIADEANARFARAHPYLDFGEGASLTLTKIRSLKTTAIDLWSNRNWELSTVAIAIVSFERLILKRLVNKANRRLAMAICLLLAYKMNEFRENSTTNNGGTETDDASSKGTTHHHNIKEVVAELEAKFGVSRRSILAGEFAVFARLDFSLHIPARFVGPHFDRILKQKSIDTLMYLEQDLYRRYILLSASNIQILQSIIRTLDLNLEERKLVKTSIVVK